MALRLPRIRIAAPACHGALAAFPLFGLSRRKADYRLACDALADGSLVVEEVDAEGSLVSLQATNRGDRRVLFLEGEELVGAKQDRVVNTSILVPARRSVRLPVSCVEHGRWVYRSQRLMASGHHAPTLVRSALKASVGEALTRRHLASANQAEIWDCVARLHDAYAVPAPTGALSAAYERHGDTIAAFQRRLRTVAGARGLALAVGERIVSIDLFDRPSTCARVWDRLLSGAVFDAIGRPGEVPSVGPWDVMSLWNTALLSRWRRVRTAGDGVELRARLDGEPASLLCCDGAVVHASIVPA
jgi:hypothetical protein